jgi:quinol-cytochrome oxidoreductase complex cytochrome b subunit
VAPPDRPAGRRSLLTWMEERFNLTEMVAFLTSFGLLPAELDTRRPLREAMGEALRRPLPSYARWPRVLGILSFLLFLFLGVTGLMLALYYQPTGSEAYASVTTLVRDVPFGWFVHQTHRWGALLFLLILAARVVRFYFQGLYRAPREAVWMLAVLLFVVATHADLTGRLLPWDARGYWTTVRAMEILYALPIIGPVFAYVMGGTDLDSLVLTRFYLLHTVLLPAVILLLYYLNFSSVRRIGLSALPGERDTGAGVFKVYLFNLTILAIFVLGGLVTLATLLPVSYGVPADPFSTPPGARPPWYLLAPHALMQLFPEIVPRVLRGLMVEAIVVVALLWPFLDRRPQHPGGRRRGYLLLGVATLIALLLLTWYGYRLEVMR